MESGQNIRVSVWHNILWSPYKAAVFSKLFEISHGIDREFLFYQICYTQKNRAKLSKINKDIHLYPYKLLFERRQDSVFPPIIWLKVLRETIKDQSDLTIISGLDSPAYWMQAIYLRLSGRKCAVFYDSTANDQAPNRFKKMAKQAFFSLVRNSLSYGVRAQSFAIAQGVNPAQAFIRCQAAFLPPDYDAESVLAERAALAPPSHAPVYLYVGRLSHEKGLSALLESFGRISAAVPAGRLRLVGDGPEMGTLRHLAASLPDPAAVQFTGPLTGTDLYREYLGATALVLPSQSEPWGLVVNEALHFGCPVIVSDRCGCVPELVEGSPCGISYSYGNRAALDSALIAALRWADDPTLVARQCHEKIAPFSAANSAHQILHAIDTIMGAPR